MKNEEQNPETQQEEQTEETTEATEETTEAEPEPKEDIDALKERLEKAEREASKFRRLFEKKKLPASTTKDEEEPNLREVVSKLELSDKKRQFGYEHNLSPKEVDMVFKFSNNNPTKEILEDEFVRGGLEKLRAKARVANNTPSSSVRSNPFQTKEWQDMSDEEKNKNFAKMVQSRFKK